MGLSEKELNWAHFMETTFHCWISVKLCFLKEYYEWGSVIGKGSCYLSVGFYRSSHQSCSIKIAVLKNFAILVGKHLYRSLFLIKLLAIKLQAWRSATFLMQLFKKETPTKVFSCEYCEIFKNTYFEEYQQTVLPKIKRT